MPTPAEKAAAEDFISKHDNLSALPANTQRIIAMANDPECDMFQLLKLVSHDAALVGRLIKAVNSSYYGLSTKITQLERAVQYLGLRGVRDYALALSLSSMVSDTPLGKWTPRHLWDHSTAVALLSREIATKARLPDPDEAFVAGILHDVGLLLMAQADPMRAQRLVLDAEGSGMSFTDVERAIFNFDHQTLGEALAIRWKLPDTISAVIANHHNPLAAPEQFRSLTCLVYCADTLCGQAAAGFPLTAAKQKVDDIHSSTAGLTPQHVEAGAAALPALMSLTSAMAA